MNNRYRSAYELGREGAELARGQKIYDTLDPHLSIPLRDILKIDARLGEMERRISVHDSKKEKLGLPKRVVYGIGYLKERF